MKLHWANVPQPAAARGPRPGTPPGTVVYAVGDIHGRNDLLAAIHRGILFDAAQRPASRRLMVYLGDYVSRGADSRGVIDRVIGWRPPGFDVVTLRGNHEDLLLRFFDGELFAGRHWLDHGGDDALAHYGVVPDTPGARDEATVAMLWARLHVALPPAHLDFLRALVTSHREGDYLFAHAGVLPGIPLGAQSDRDLMWIRNRFLRSDADHGAVVVHGHCIAPEPEVRHNRIGIDTGAFRSGVLTCLVLDGTERSFLQTQPEPPDRIDAAEGQGAASTRFAPTRPTKRTHTPHQ